LTMRMERRSFENKNRPPEGELQVFRLEKVKKKEKDTISWKEGERLSRYGSEKDWVAIDRKRK